jgi:hypothetical protein
MNSDLDTFLVRLYTIVDDLYNIYVAPHKPIRRGHVPELSDSEVVTLAILEQGYGTSEQAFWQYVNQHLRTYFPRLIDRTCFNRRTHDLYGVMARLVPIVAAIMQTESRYEVIDTVPVELMSRCRGDRYHLFNCEASIGHGGSDREWYYGCKLLLSVTEHGAVTGFAVAPAATEDRWVAEFFLCWRHDPTAEPWTPQDLPRSHKKGGGRRGATGYIYGRTSAGPPSAVPYLADVGFSGAVWEEHWRLDYDSRVITKQGQDKHAAQVWCHEICSRRQVIETVNAQLVDVLHLRLPRARSIWGLLTRLAAKVLACNIGRLINSDMGRPAFALATLFTF